MRPAIANSLRRQRSERASVTVNLSFSCPLARSPSAPLSLARSPLPASCFLPSPSLGESTLKGRLDSRPSLSRSFAHSTTSALRDRLRKRVAPTPNAAASTHSIPASISLPSFFLITRFLLYCTSLPFARSFCSSALSVSHNAIGFIADPDCSARRGSDVDHATSAPRPRHPRLCR